MSYIGLVCAIGHDMQVNKAFYPSVGHRWQAITGEGYVYLEGDGTPEGMKITAWN